MKSGVGAASSYHSLAIKVPGLLLANAGEFSLCSPLFSLARAVDRPALVLDGFAAFIACVPPLLATAGTLKTTPFSIHA
jgi:hypothetical protein